MTYEKTLILLSGSIGAGKTTLAVHMERNYAASRISTADILSALVGCDLDRSKLQQVGLERRFQGGEWIADAVVRSTLDYPAAKIIVVDALRTAKQVRAMRDLAAGKWRILHVHLTADSEQLVQRYNARSRRMDSGINWSVVTRYSSQSLCPM